MEKQNGKSESVTERLILEAAAEEFSLKGFDGARTSVIAAKAGVTHTMLHYYFRTKEKLFERIFKDKLESIMDMMLSLLTTGGATLKERMCVM